MHNISVYFLCKRPRHSAGQRVRKRLLALCATLGLMLFSHNSIALDPGPLDEPLPQSIFEVNEHVAEQLADKLVEEVKEAQQELAQESRSELTEKAEDGQRLAQVELGADFAEEATLLGFAPEAANDAAADALRWYSLAAQRGFPGAPSLDRSGVRFFPVRVQRSR